MMSWTWSRVVATVCLLCGTLAVPREAFFPFGDEQGDKRLLVGDDVSSEEIQLSTPIAFYDERFQSLFINLNGHLSFETELPTYKSDLVLPVGFKVISAFLADIDTRLSGNVYYRETEDPSLLELLGREVAHAFPKESGFIPNSILIVTWDDIGYFKQQYDKTNTFQIAVGSDGRQSYVLFHYEDEGLQWLRSEGKSSPSIQDIPGQAGFDSGERGSNPRYYTLPGSGNLEVAKLVSKSNVGKPGMWMFRVGLLNGGNIETPETYATEGTGRSAKDTQDVQGDEPRSCSGGGARNCHSNARCVDNAGGYCCECIPPSYGNGRSCLEPGAAQRVNGKVSGTINGYPIVDQDLHAYVVTNDGRAYTAISRLPENLGVSLQTAYPIGSIIGWLFAKTSSPKAKNGFMITGGDFNRTAVIRYLSGGETLTIKQQFISQDAVGYMRVNTEVNGNVPEVALGMKVSVDDYKEEYSRVDAGNIKSFTTHTYHVDGSPRKFTAEQTITYKECASRPSGESDILRLNVIRNFLVYGEREQIVRYAMTNRISTFAGSDPCREPTTDCDFNANCIPTGDTYRCECKPGYHGDGRRCVDLDECRQGNNECDRNAQCYNTEGSYECRCLPGYAGNGRQCVRDLTCADIVCDLNARCVYDPEANTPLCECNAGFYGDGSYCQEVEVEEQCNVLNNCDFNARCIPQGRGYTCLCNPGYRGDGYRCESETQPPQGQGCDVVNDCDINAVCQYDPNFRRYQCACNAGYTGDGYRCVAEDCSVRREICDGNAQCVYDRYSGHYMCVCNEGFEGDGSYCRQAGLICNQVCDVNAECILDDSIGSGGSVCRCNAGYYGDGSTCTPIGDCSVDYSICDSNARCTRRDDQYICVCNQGFRGDGRRCQPVGDTSTYLMYAQGMSIMQVPFRPTEENPGRHTLVIPGQTAIGIDVDCYSRYFYWTDVAGKSVNRAKLDGTDSEVLVNGLGSPEGIAVDWIAKNMYWTDSGMDRIEVAHVDGTERNRKTLFYEGLVNPRAIVLDPAMGVMFWSDWNRDAPKIETAYMDGTNRKVLVDENLGLPNGLAINYDDRQVCWADAGTMHIECVNYDGRGRRTIYALASYPFGITFANGIFYWTDWDMKTMPNIDKYGGEPNDALKLPVGGNGRMYGVAAVKEQCPSGSNACVLNNGGCRFLCLPTPNGGRTCTCPDNIDEEECNRIGLL